MKDKNVRFFIYDDSIGESVKGGFNTEVEADFAFEQIDKGIITEGCCIVECKDDNYRKAFEEVRYGVAIDELD